jgi:hypothetical protein
MSPVAHNSGDSGDVSSYGSALAVRASSSGMSLGDYQQVRLTETLLNK